MEIMEVYKYQTIKAELRKDILNQKSGTKLPGRNQLAQQYGTARATVEHAISELIGEGILTSKKGSGTFVSWKKDQLILNNDLTGKLVNLSSNEKKTVALLISNVNGDIYPYIWRGVQSVSDRHGIDLIVCKTNNEMSKQEELIRKLSHDGVGHFVIVPAIRGEFNPHCFYELKEAGIPFVTCYRPLQSIYAPGVFANSFQSGFICTEHLIKHGCKKIAYISAPLYATSFDRYQGYLLAHEIYHRKHYKELLFFDKCFDTSNIGGCVTDELLSKFPDVDGIFSFNDRIACGIYESMAKRGLKPGVDIKIVSCDDTSICMTLDVKLTSARFPSELIGERAAQLLLQLFEGNETDDMRKDVVSAELMIRNSCGCGLGFDSI